MKEIQDEQAAIEALREGSSEAFRYLYRLHSPAIFAFLKKITTNESMAEELLQETFLRMLQKINFFQNKENKANAFKNWVFRIANNLAMDQFRKQKHMKRYVEQSLKEEPHSPPSPEEVNQSKTSIQDFKQAYEKLSPRQQRFLHLKIDEGMKYWDISQICGCSVDVVKQEIFRARAQLRRLLCLN